MSKPIINALLISAGFSGRMGDFKPLLKLNDKSFISLITEKLLSVCENVVIVTGFRNDEVESEVRKVFQSEENEFATRVKCVFNNDYKEGMFTSVKAGLEQLQNSDWVLFHFVDQPGMPAEFYEEFISHVNDKYDWIQPVYELKQGHPVLFNKSVIPRILESPAYYRMKLIREDNAVKKKYWVTNYNSILEDIDTKEDFEKFIEFSNQEPRVS
jgi:molybdenum cofactor cytidylyltransferase